MLSWVLGGWTVWGWWMGFLGHPSPRQEQYPVLSVNWEVGRVVSRGPGEKKAGTQQSLQEHSQTVLCLLSKPSTRPRWYIT